MVTGEQFDQMLKYLERIAAALEHIKERGLEIEGKEYGNDIAVSTPIR